MFVVKFCKSCLITYLGVIFAVGAMYFSFNLDSVGGVEAFRLALICLMLSGVCDMFDGKFARRCKREKLEKEMGIQMDSLADTICFLVVPVVIMYSMEMSNLVYLLIYAYFLISGITRLAYFNVSQEVDKVASCYNGLPVTSTAVIFPLLGLINIFVNFDNIELVFAFATVLIGFLFNFKIKIPKFKTNAMIIISALALLLLLAFILF